MALSCRAGYQEAVDLHSGIASGRRRRFPYLRLVHFRSAGGQCVAMRANVVKIMVSGSFIMLFGALSSRTHPRLVCRAGRVVCRKPVLGLREERWWLIAGILIWGTIPMTWVTNWTIELLRERAAAAGYIECDGLFDRLRPNRASYDLRAVGRSVPQGGVQAQPDRAGLRHPAAVGLGASMASSSGFLTRLAPYTSGGHNAALVGYPPMASARRPGSFLFRFGHFCPQGNSDTQLAMHADVVRIATPVGFVMLFAPILVVIHIVALLGHWAGASAEACHGATTKTPSWAMLSWSWSLPFPLIFVANWMIGVPLRERAAAVSYIEYDGIFDRLERGRAYDLRTVGGFVPQGGDQAQPDRAGFQHVATAGVSPDDERRWFLPAWCRCTRRRSRAPWWGIPALLLYDAFGFLSVGWVVSNLREADARLAAHADMVKIMPAVAVVILLLPALLPVTHVIAVIVNMGRRRPRQEAGVRAEEDQWWRIMAILAAGGSIAVAAAWAIGDSLQARAMAAGYVDCDSVFERMRRVNGGPSGWTYVLSADLCLEAGFRRGRNRTRILTACAQAAPTPRTPPAFGEAVAGEARSSGRAASPGRAPLFSAKRRRWRIMKI